MKENGNATSRQTPGSGAVAPPIPAPANGHTVSTHVHANGFPGGYTPRVNFTPWTALELLTERWHWLVIGLLVGGGAFFCLAWYVIKPKFTATAQLLRFEPIGRSDYFKTAPVSSDTFANLIRAPELLESVGAQLTPPVRAETFAKFIKVEADPDSDLVKLYLAARHPQQAVDWLNLYATNAVEYTRRIESKELNALAKGYLKKEVGEIDSDVKAVEQQFLDLRSGTVPPGGATNSLVQVDARLNALKQRMDKAVIELDDLRTKYTEINPRVVAQREAISSLQKEMTEAATNHTGPAIAFLPPATGAAGQGLSPELDILHIKLRALEDGRLELLKRLREAELYAANTPGAVRIFAPASLSNVKTNLRWLKLTIVPMVGAGMGLVASVLLVLLVEVFDRRLKNAEDVSRVTQLPVLASLRDLRAMEPGERAQWAFRAWTMLQGRLSPTANHGLICGITSSAPGEGRSTWISLLAEAASLTGFRVLTIATRPSPTHVDADEEPAPDFEPAELSAPRPPSNGNALTTSVLSAPSQVTERLTGPNSQPVVHIPLPGWVWNLERRVQWREALEHWRQIDNLVILVELPPASVPEAVLLGSNLPNLVWLANSGVPDAAETRRQLETLRYARCNLVGAVLNRISGTPVRKWFPRWMGCVALAGALAAAEAPVQGIAVPATNAPVVPALAQGAGTDPASQERGFFTIVNPDRRADWQRNLTLGPGDVLSFDLYGSPELTLKDVAIAPDGRISYLEATNLLASGLTVDQLRDHVDKQLSLFRRAPHAIITPTAFRSKKYFVLGKVNTKGVFILDRPLTVLEAIARAHGVESALVDRYLVELADFDHSFLARGGKRFPINFNGLFQRGDLSQNIAVEPDDYIYIAPGDVKQVYVVGEVRLPGPVTYVPNLSVIAAITQRGGYTDRAFKARVLVIRGSLHNPSGIVVNTHSTLDGGNPDFQLQPRDIIYVNSRPFIKVEEAADLAATAFIQSIITAWVGVDVVKPINQ